MKELIISFKKYEKYVSYNIYVISIVLSFFMDKFFPHKQKAGIKDEKS